MSLSFYSVEAFIEGLTLQSNGIQDIDDHHRPEEWRNLDR